MAGGSGALGFGAGLAQGLASGLLRKTEQERDDARRAEDKQRQNDIALLPFALKQLEESGDASGVQQIFERLNPEMGKLFKKQGGGPFEMLAPLLTQQQPQSEAASLLAPGNEAIGNVLGPEQAPIPSVQKAGISQPSQPRWMFGETVLPNHAERQAREVSEITALEGAKLDAQTQAKLNLAKRLRETDPTMSVEDSLFAVGLKVPKEQFGVIPSGGGVLNRSTGEIIEAPSARATNLPATLRERVEEARALHPEMSEDQLKAVAAKAIDDERAADRQSKADAAEGAAATRALLNETRRTNLALLQRNNQSSLTPAQARLANTLADDFVRDSKPYVERLDAYNTLKSAVDGPHTPGSDLSAVFAFMKMIDPGSTVREGERAIVEQSRGVPDGIRNLYNSIVEGKRLTTEQRADLMNQASQQFVPFKARQAVTEQTYRRRAASQGIAADNVIIQYDVPTAQAPAGAAGGAGATAPPAAGAQSFTVTYTDPKTGKSTTKVFPTQAARDQFARAAGVK